MEIENRKSPIENTSGSRRPMLYLDIYPWFVFFAAMDIMMTWIILWRGGSEANPIAKMVLQAVGLKGFVAYKMALTLLVILICEWVGRSRLQSGRRFALFALAIGAVPVVWSFILLFAHQD